MTAPEPRNVELEAAIAASPDDPTVYAVYGDWFQQQGVARGDLIALQLHSPEGSNRSREHRDRERKLITSPELNVLPTQHKTWRWGFVQSLRVEAPLDVPATWFTDVVVPALAHPSCRFLRSLELGGGHADAVLPHLRAETTPALERLDVACNEFSCRDLPELGQLTELSIHCQLLTAGPLVLKRLRALALPLDGTSDTAIARVIRSVAPSLRSLSLHCVDEMTHASLAVVLAEAPAALESLQLSADAMSADAIDAIAQAPFIAQLQKLDLSASGLSEDGARSVLARSASWPSLLALVLGEDAVG